MCTVYYSSVTHNENVISTKHWSPTVLFTDANQISGSKSGTW